MSSIKSQSLSFRKSLLHLSTPQLIDRLSCLLDQLLSLDQDTVLLSSLDPIRSQLIHPSLLVHKDRAAKALLACCLADLLRLYAPDAPYTLPELRDIFQFFFRQLRFISPDLSSCPNLAHYTRLLDCLTTVQSIVLVCDVPQSDQLILQIFSVLFSVVSLDLPQNLLLSFADVLTQIIAANSSPIPSPLIKLLLDQFHPKASKSNPAAYRLAVDVCNASEDHLKQPVGRFLNDLLASPSPSSDDLAHDSDQDSVTLRHSPSTQPHPLRHTHTLIKHIYRPCPGLLQSVIPRLEVDLQCSDPHLRLLTLHTLAELIAEQPINSSAPGPFSSSTLSKPDLNSSSSHPPPYNHQHTLNYLLRNHPSTWAIWLREANDRCPQIRLAVVQWCRPILSKHPHLHPHINRILDARLTDSDEKVRLESCRLLGSIDFEMALHHINLNVLKTLAGRIEDRKPLVQQQALKSLGRLFSLAYTAIEAECQEAISQFSWIPQAFLSSMFIGDLRLAAAVETSFLQFITPLPNASTEIESSVDRLLCISKYMDHITLKKLKAFARIGLKRPNPFDRYLEVHEAYNGGVMDEYEKEITARLAHVIRVLSGLFPDSRKAVEDLQKFAKLNDKPVCKLLRALSDEDLDSKTCFAKVYEEFHRRIKSYSGSLAETMTMFLIKSSYLLLNTASVPTLIQRISARAIIVQDDGSGADDDGCEISPGSRDSSTSDRARFFLDIISSCCPKMLRRHVGELVNALPEPALTGTDNLTAEGCLLGLSQLAKTNVEVVPSDESFVQLVQRFVLDGNQIQAKLAAAILAAKSGSLSGSCTRVNDKLADSLSEAPSDRLLVYLGALSQIAKHAPRIFETHGAAVTTFIVNTLLVQVSEGEKEGQEDWVDDEDESQINKARVQGLKVLTQRCIIYASTPEARNFSKPIFKLLWQLIEGEGKVGPVKHSPAVASRLRLAASLSVLKLATYSVFGQEIQARFECIAGMAQDPLYQVREQFIGKLVKYLQQRRLVTNNGRFDGILFLVAHDPEPSIVRLARVSVQSRLRVGRQPRSAQLFETVLVQLLHLLAHHPDFKPTAAELGTFAKYIEFFIECVADAENVSLLYHLAGQLKAVRDAESQTHSEYLYVLSELAQLLIKTKAVEHHWSLPTYPGKVKLPNDIFRGLPTPAVAHEIAKKVFLPEDFLGSFTRSRGTTTTTFNTAVTTGTGSVGGSAGTGLKKRNRAVDEKPKRIFSQGARGVVKRKKKEGSNGHQHQQQGRSNLKMNSKTFMRDNCSDGSDGEEQPEQQQRDDDRSLGRKLGRSRNQGEATRRSARQETRTTSAGKAQKQPVRREQLSGSGDGENSCEMDEQDKEDDGESQ